MNTVKSISNVVELMDSHLRKELLKDDKKLWENTYIKHQIDKRDRKEPFYFEDHIRGMVYSMLSSNSAWERMDNGIDKQTGKILPIDKIFHEYDVPFILKSSSEEIVKQIKDVGGGSQSIKKQVDALIKSNIPKLQVLEKQYGNIDICYKKYIDVDNTLKMLIIMLSSPSSQLKMHQMGEALVAEYLRNVGYDIAKPDRHIRRILGCEYLGCSDNKLVPVFETMDIIKKIADYLGKNVAEIDYILWSYCAKGYGEICTLKNQKCEMCVAKKYCNYFKHNLDAKGVIRNE